ncbi:MAG: T9SS type A sorting domain-containing protein [Salibacteraceae bacterium]
MKSIVKLLLIGCFITLGNYGFSQCSCLDIKIIELKDTITASGQVGFTFKMTSDSSNCNSGYSDFWFVDQTGDTINQWTGAGMWMPNPMDPMFDTTEYVIALKPGYPSFPANFSGNLQVWNPDCTIPFTFAALSTKQMIGSNPDIQLFPNPTSNTVNVSNQSNLRLTSIEVYGSDGRLVLMESSTTHFISVKTLKPGIYFVKLLSEERLITVKKLIKN